jgi:hypothetical protein
MMLVVALLDRHHAHDAPANTESAVQPWITLVVWLIALCGALYRMARDQVVRHPTTYIQADLLRGQKPDHVWAFGGEPEIYYYWRQPILIPDRDLATHRGNPAAFVAGLRSAGFRYLTFAIGLTPSVEAMEPQPFTAPARQPLRRDLLALLEAPQRYGLTRLGTAPAERASRAVYLFAINPSTP